MFRGGCFASVPQRTARDNERLLGRSSSFIVEPLDRHWTRKRPEYPINKPKQDINISFLLYVLGRPPVLNVLPCPPSCGMWHDVSDAGSNLMWFIQTQAKGPKFGFWHKQKCKGSQIKVRAARRQTRRETAADGAKSGNGGLWHTAEVTVGINLLQAFCCSWQRHVRAPSETATM